MRSVLFFYFRIWDDVTDSVVFMSLMWFIACLVPLTLVLYADEFCTPLFFGQMVGRIVLGGLLRLLRTVECCVLRALLLK